MVRSLSTLSLILVLAPAALAEAPHRTHAITVEDYFTVSGIVQQAISPDGKYVAYTEGRWQKSTNDRKADLWVVECDRKKTRRLTFDRANDAFPQWSSDSKTIYFLGRRKREGEKQPPHDGSAQVWRVDRDGGELFAVTRVAGGIQAFDLAPDGKSLFYQVGVDRTDGEWKELKQRFKDVEYGHGAGKVSQLWKLDLERWRDEKVVDEGRVIREFKVSPDGSSVAMITTPDDKVVSFEGRSRVDVFDLKTKKTKTIPNKVFRADAPSPYGWLEQLAWNRKGDALAFNVIFDGYPAEIVVARRDAENWTSTLLRRPPGVHVHGYGSPVHWDGNAHVLFLGESKGRVRLTLALEAREGSPSDYQVKTPGDVVAEAFSVSANGCLAVVMNAATHTPDLFLAGREQRPVRLTNLNPQVDTWKLPQLSVVSWKAPDGTPVEGILELPPDYKKGENIPLVVAIHGGPTTADRFHLQFWIYGRTLLPAKGYAVLCPNYRGSTGYGDKFLTDLIGRENDLDVEDILSGVDHLVKEGIADPERLGVMGWSNGGYLTNCCITKSNRFKAASSGAGIVDTVMEWGANDEPAYAIVFKKGFPWNQPDLYRKTSPTYALDKIRTPTLIHVGGSDERCPPGHSRMLYRALKEYVKVPAELLVYPGEEHGIMKYSSREAKMRWDLAWFDRHILGKGKK
ncbi:MAG: S9 family peptidase [Planctomycetes bacterium]|nr:S9 family peptidase [Planctomycetota bacterium]